jgi:HlyD family secretion protein
MTFAEKTTLSIRRHMLAGAAACIVMVAGVGGLAASTKLAGAVIAPGTLVVDSNVKRVQHPSGGVVAQINVRDGQSVRAGDILVRLNETVAKANYAIVSKSLDELDGRVARLEAERDGAQSIAFPASLADRRDDSLIAKVMAGEESLFRFRQVSRESRQAQLRERIAQLKIQVGGLTQQRTAKKSEIELVAQQLGGLRTLWDKKLTSIDRLTAIEREAVRLQGEEGQLTATIAQANGQIAEIELQILQIDQDLRTEVGTQLREAQARSVELGERKVAAQDMLDHIDIRSPQDGVVHQLAVHTIGGVIGAGEQIMLIVPLSDRLIVEANVSPQDIDQLRVGQNAELRLSAFNRQTTPDLQGVLTKISPDLTINERTGAGFYRTRVEIPPEELKKLDGLSLVPGMPSEVFFATGDRTILSYLAKPLIDQISRAMREE